MKKIKIKKRIITLLGIGTIGISSIIGLSNCSKPTNPSITYLSDLRVGDDLSGKTLVFNTSNVEPFTYDSSKMTEGYDLYYLYFSEKEINNECIECSFVDGPTHFTHLSFETFIFSEHIPFAISSQDSTHLTWEREQFTFDNSRKFVITEIYGWNQYADKHLIDRLPDVRPFNDTKVI